MIDCVVTIEHYASGSALACKNDRIYLVGDDMNYVLILDKSLNVVDSLLLGDSAKYRISKHEKEDLEAATFIGDDQLLLLGSGSKRPFRNAAWIINTTSRQKRKIVIDRFYDSLFTYGINDVNIEGATRFNNQLLLSNRGNKSFPKNHLIITAGDFHEAQQTAITKVMEIKNESKYFSGVSGLEYSSKSDRLLLTISTEDTYDTHSDGVIGKSFLWIIDRFSTKKNQPILKADKAIDLGAIDNRFLSQKIESVCIVSEAGNIVELVLVSDNDNGNSTLFKLTVSL